jgi:Phosphatidylinositol N-acetylglucosaminyltransferase
MAFQYIKVLVLSIYYYDRLSSVLSMNAAVSASVVLASRLSTNVSVFALVLFSILSFALFPILRRRLQVKLSLNLLLSLTDCALFRQSSCSNAVWLLITAGSWISAVLLVARLSRTVMWIYFSILFFVTLIAPAVLIWAQRYKKFEFSFCVQKNRINDISFYQQHHSWTMGRGCSQGKIDSLHSLFINSVNNPRKAIYIAEQIDKRRYVWYRKIIQV